MIERTISFPIPGCSLVGKSVSIAFDRVLEVLGNVYVY